MTRRVAFVGMLVAGFALGAAVVTGLHAQAAKKPAFVIAEVQVTDPAAFKAYAARVPATLKPHNGRVIVRGKPIAKEGEAPKGDLVVVAFDSLADAQKWYSTPPYRDLIPERQKAATSRVYIVEGLPPR
jgi:uncharacterized protein (DUF1330 family)